MHESPKISHSKIYGKREKIEQEKEQTDVPRKPSLLDVVGKNHLVVDLIGCPKRAQYYCDKRPPIDIARPASISPLSRDLIFAILRQGNLNIGFSRTSIKLKSGSPSEKLIVDCSGRLP